MLDQACKQASVFHSHPETVSLPVGMRNFSVDVPIQPSIPFEQNDNQCTFEVRVKTARSNTETGGLDHLKLIKNN